MNIIDDILNPAIDEANSSLGEGSAISKAPDTVLFGEGGLESMALIRFIVLVEERIEDVAGVQLTLASEKAMSRRHSPFQTVQTLADYIAECLQEEGIDA